MSQEKEEEYVDLYSDLFETDGTSAAAAAALVPQSAAKCTTIGTSSSALDEELIFLSHLGSLETEVKELRAVRQSLTAENAQLHATLAGKERTIAVLRNNISSLYKTAKLELERRTAEIAELRREYDSLVFRRRTAAQNAQNAQNIQAAVLAPSSPAVGTSDSEKENKSGEIRNRDARDSKHSSYSTPRGSTSTSTRYSPYSTPRSDTSSSERYRSEQWKHSSSSSGRHCSSSSTTPPSRHQQHSQPHRSRLFH